MKFKFISYIVGISVSIHQTVFDWIRMENGNDIIIEKLLKLPPSPHPFEWKSIDVKQMMMYYIYKNYHNYIYSLDSIHDLPIPFSLVFLLFFFKWNIFTFNFQCVNVKGKTPKRFPFWKVSIFAWFYEKQRARSKESEREKKVKHFILYIKPFYLYPSFSFSWSNQSLVVTKVLWNILIFYDIPN